MIYIKTKLLKSKRWLFVNFLPSNHVLSLEIYCKRIGRPNKTLKKNFIAKPFPVMPTVLVALLL